MNEENMILNLPYLERKAISFTTHEYVVEKALPVSNYRFRQITADPMQDHQEIQDNIDNMYYDGHKYHCLLIYDKENGDGLLVESEGYSYARYAQYIPQQHGTRPVVVVQNDKGNHYSTTTIVVPITSRDKHYLPTHVALCTNIFEKQSMALAEQVMTVSKDRLTRFIGTLSFSDMQKIDKALRISLEI